MTARIDAADAALVGAPERGGQELDVGAYFARIGFDGQPTVSAETLRRLHRGHVAAIPFENLEIVLGRPVPLDLNSLQDKLIGHRRGGYCYEHNLLFAALLEQLGYPVNHLLARVHPSVDGPGPRTHMALAVEADGLSWLADVGFGAGILEPIPLTDGITVSEDGWTYRLDLSHNVWRLRTLGPSGWSDLYSFTEETQHRADYEIVNYYTATNPASPFVGQIVTMRGGPDARHRLIGQELTTTAPDGTSERRHVHAADLANVLAGIFGIDLEPADAACLRVNPSGSPSPGTSSEMNGVHR